MFFLTFSFGFLLLSFGFPIAFLWSSFCFSYWFLLLFSSSFSSASFRFATLLTVRVDSFCSHLGCHFGVILGVILGSCWGHVGVILVYLWGLWKDSLLSARFCSFRTPLRAQLEPKLASKLGRVGLKNDILLRSNFEFVSEGILEPLGLDFGSRLGSEIEHKNDLKISSAKNAKFDSRCSRSSIFDVPGSSKIDQKTMPKGLRDKTSSWERKKLEKAPNIDPTWGPKTVEDATKRASRRRWKATSKKEHEKTCKKTCLSIEREARWNVRAV